MTIREVLDLQPGDGVVLFSVETALAMHIEVVEAHRNTNDIFFLDQLAHISIDGWRRNQDLVFFVSFSYEGLAKLRFDFGTAYVPIEYIKCKM